MPVTPFAGVWIEIESVQPEWQEGCVTPFAGVWIEIIRLCREPNGASRHPLRGGVDRNLTNAFRELPGGLSPPSRGCGLK